MNPNQLPSYQSYIPQNQNNNYQQYQLSTYTPYQPQLSPQNMNPSMKNDNFQINRNRLDKAMYTSSIEPNMLKNNYTSNNINKLQTLGQYISSGQQLKNQSIKYKPDPNIAQMKEFNYQYQKHQMHQNNKQEKQKMFSSFIAPSTQQNTEFDRFPAFNLKPQPSKDKQPQNSSSIQTSVQNQEVVETAEEKRRKQILAIKQQLELINKKMENSSANRKFNIEKNDNTQKSNSNNIQNNNFQGVSMNNQGSSNSNNLTHIQLNNPTNNSSTNYQTLYSQRPKNLIAQSMILISQPTPGYKFQSIFDKYESMKKPTYEIISETKKQEKPLLLEQLIKKNSNQKTTHSFNSIINNDGETENKNTTINMNNQANNKYQSVSNINKNNAVYDNNSNSYPKVINSSSNILNLSNSSSSSTNSSSNSTTIQSSIQQTGMFKKKKQAPQIQDVANSIPIAPSNHTDLKSIINSKQITSPKTLESVLMFKKKQNTIPNEDNFFTNIMKKNNIQQNLKYTKEDFSIGKKLGKGQFGQVMLVQHKKTGFLCGMKVMQKKQIRDQKYEGQIARQLSIQFYLAHRNIAPLYGYFQDIKNVYLLVEYCTGGQLLEMLRKNRRMQQPQVSRVIKQIIQGIDYIHKQLIIHRDIKPENILFNFGVAKICDFGWAVYKGLGMRKTASVGSPLYYSPEIVMGVEYDEKIDIWDIGMMTYECLLGKIPFRIYSELDLNRIVEDEIKFPEYIDTSDQAKDFILKIMKKKPQQRMQIREMLRHPFITKYQDVKLQMEIMKDIKQVLTS